MLPQLLFFHNELLFFAKLLFAYLMKLENAGLFGSLQYIGCELKI
jgi:hypothetical protein